MSVYPFMQVDAFTSQPLGGNPCAILFDTDEMDDATMLAIAREMNLSETAFVRRSEIGDFGVRYFTPSEEIPLAGHPTIATTFALVSSGRLKLAGNPTRIHLELPVGLILVEIFSQNDHIERIVMSQKKPRFLELYPAEQVLPVFGLKSEEALPGAPIQTVSTGTPQLMIPLKSLDSLRRAQLDINAYNELRARADFFSPHLFCLTGVTPAGDTFARHFGTPPDVFEDPFTGSATGGMGAYLWRYDLIQKPNFTAEQGHWMHRPGQAEVQVIGSRTDIKTVKVSGNAVSVIRGAFEL